MHFKINIAIALTIALTTTVSLAQTPTAQAETNYTPQYTIDGDLLSALGKNTISDIKLQAAGYTPISYSADKVKQLLQTSLLDLSLALTFSENNTLSLRQIFELAISPSINDPVIASGALFKYIEQKPKDHHIITQWVNYRLNNLNDRKSRDLFLQSQFNQLNEYPTILCQAVTQKALLTAETGDQAKAVSLFKYAISLNPYNVNTLKHLTSLLSAMPLSPSLNSEIRITEIMLARLKVLENPFSIDKIFALTEILDNNLAYELSNTFYEYGHALNNAILHQEDSGYLLYSKQLANNYSAKLYKKCFELSDVINKLNPYDLLARSYKAKAMEHLGNKNQAKLIYEASIKSINKKINSTQEANNKALLYQQLAYYYTVINIDAQKGFHFSQQALQLAPSNVSHEILALAYLHQKEIAKAKSTLKQVKSPSQLSTFANILLLSINDQKDEALQYYDNLLEYPIGFIGENIINIIKNYRPEINDQSGNENTFITNALSNYFNNKDLKIFETPEDSVEYIIKLEQKSDYYTFGNPIKANIYLRNNTKSKVLLSQGSWVSPNILITASVEPVSHNTPIYSKKQHKQLPTMILLHKNLNQQPIINSGEYNKTSDYLNVGPLKEILSNHPQQTFRITFNTLINPVKNAKGEWVSINADFKAPKITIIRKGFIASQNNLKDLYKNITKVNNALYINNINLAGALTKEALSLKNGRGRFTFKKINTNAILNWLNKNLTHNDFRVRFWTLNAFNNFPLNKNGAISTNIVNCLSDDHIEVAYVAAKVLSSCNIDLDSYYRWSSQEGESDLIIKQGKLMLNQNWEKPTLPYLFEHIQQQQAIEESEDSNSKAPE